MINTPGCDPLRASTPHSSKICFDIKTSVLTGKTRRTRLLFYVTLFQAKVRLDILVIRAARTKRISIMKFNVRKMCLCGVLKYTWQFHRVFNLRYFISATLDNIRYVSIFTSLRVINFAAVCCV